MNKMVLVPLCYAKLVLPWNKRSVIKSEKFSPQTEIFGPILSKYGTNLNTHYKHWVATTKIINDKIITSSFLISTKI